MSYDYQLKENPSSATTLTPKYLKCAAAATAENRNLRASTWDDNI